MIENYIEEKLKPLNISRNEFSELLIRLLDYGVICRDESQIEATLYDRFLICTELVESYLSMLSVRIQHDRQFSFIRVYPPGAQVPGMLEQDELPFNGGFRARPNQQDVAVILVLRAEYEKSLREGQIDERGCSLISLEGLAIAMTNLLRRPLPESSVERKNVFRRLRQLRLIQFNAEDELDSEDTWLRIQPAITSFVSEDVLKSLGEALDAASDEDQDSEKDSDVPSKLVPSKLFGEEEV